MAFAVRAAALWAAADASLALDEKSYALRAGALLDGKGFLGSYQSWVRHGPGLLADLPQYPGAWQPPGQTVFMAAVMAASGRSLLAVKLAQVMLGTLCVGLVYALGRAWFDRRCGLAAAWLCALYPNLIAFTHYLWSETLFSFLLLGALWLLTRRPGPPTPGSALLGGALLGLGALTRGTLLYFLPVLLAWLVWTHRSGARVALARAALVASVALLVVAPWAVRNTRVHGGFVMIETNGPYNLWRGNGADAFAGRGDPRTPHYAWPFEGVPLAPVGNRSASRLVEEAKRALGSQEPTDLQIIGYARHAAWRSILDDPAAFFSRIRYRLIDMWNPTSFLIRHFRLGAYGEVPHALQASVTAAAVLGYLLAMGLACAGFWLARRRPQAWLVLLLVAFFSGVSALAFGLTRFRLPLVPPLIVLGSPAAVALLDRLWPRSRRPAAGGSALCTLLLLLVLAGCGEPGRAPAAGGPNILWVVWDTVRADHMSLYGYGRKTTPRLDAWAQEARVFENATSTAGYTLPSHASMFTGLLPSEHCTHNGHQRLDDRYTTLAELLRGAGYRTFLFSANPQISASPARNFGQGFETTEHPWSPRYAEAALELVERKLPPEDRSSELPEQLRQARSGEGRLTAWNIKAAGEIAQRATLAWLDSLGDQRPWLVFLNYMEAHRPYIPPREYRERMMSAQEVERSYRVDRSWLPMWEYTFGLREYSEEEMSLTRATYDATLRELDDLFAELLDALERAGHLDDTIVILTSDHGEHLGEQHMLDHQYSVYEPLLRVPLVIHYPGRVEPGRDPRPVMNFDVFPTLLELAGLAAPEQAGSQAVSLLSPREQRARLAEEPESSEIGIRQVLATHPGWDPSRYQRRLRALTRARYKYIWASDGRHELFDLAEDPLEKRNLVASRSEVSNALAEELESRYAMLQLCRVTVDSAQPRGATPAERDMLETLGYLEKDDDRSR